ncbi:MAG: TIGR03936 family radical SAM-associated protein [Clostridiales bacterium]|nr:TIGR03936 family radical SAM-associated protein [Clostridiales bacterium]
MREVRLIFSKTGRCKYISHLDINRCMSRAISRAEIPIWYTEGYNPRPYMSFSLPLSLGVESLCESVDIRLVKDISNDEIKSRMNQMLPPDIRIIDVLNNFRDCREIAFSDYVFKFEFKDNISAFNKIKEVLNNDNITVIKKAKKGKKRIEKEVNIKPLIDKYDISLNENEIVMSIRLCAGTEKNLNPTLLFDEIIKLINMDFEWKSITRMALLDAEYNIFK